MNYKQLLFSTTSLTSYHLLAMEQNEEQIYQSTAPEEEAAYQEGVEETRCCTSDVLLRLFLDAVEPMTILNNCEGITQ